MYIPSGRMTRLPLHGTSDYHGQDSLRIHDRYNSTSIEELKCNLLSDIALCPLSSTLI